MPTKESIVQRLLDEKLITAKEAVVLLKTENTKWLPNPNPQPWIGPGTTLPYQPYTAPNTPYNPMFPQCDWTVRPDQMPLYGGTTSYTGSFAHTTNENLCAK
jgi:hypothetical protein